MPQKHTEPESPPGKRGQMTVEEAGRLGGHKGGQRVRELIREGKEAERAGAGEDIENSESEEEDEGEA